MTIRATIERYLSPNISTCLKCNRPWKTNAVKKIGTRPYLQLKRMRYYGLVGVKSHSTFYIKGRGCFPLCKPCWQSLTIEERIPYYVELCRQWVRYGDGKRYVKECALMINAVLRGG